jgi:class 3 adenylate cyclase/tetratricopeptide (TPR) repeat protein
MPDPLSQELLRPYLPRLLLQWLTETADADHRRVDGSVAFVDISGFTRLSERLAKRGKVGAEELTDAIGSCFARLLGVAYSNGGGLIKFGGDALLLLFTGPGHPARAARAAIGMRRELREIGSLSTPGGRVALKMSVGVHSGAFDFFLVGEEHRELIITGPAASQTVLMESTAEAGEILTSPSTAAELPPACIGAPKGPGFLLRREPAGIEPEARTPEAVANAEDMLACIPAGWRDHVLSALHEPEHKRVTIAFIHFDETDALIEREGEDAAARALSVLVNDVQRAAKRHGVCFLGSDVDHDGGKIILTAGAPTGSENDEERMLLTVREIAECEGALPVRIGVNKGHVFAGDIGPFYRRTYTVMGDAVNLSARLMAKAAAGQIITTDSVLQPSRTRFQTTALEPFFVKGKSQPIQAFTVGARAQAPARAAKSETSTPLVGREHEIAVLTEALASAKRSEGRIVEIVGEPGIGKSRLIEELRKSATGVATLQAACELYHASTPYSPLVGLLRRVFAISEMDEHAVAAERLRGIVAAAAPHLLPWVPLLGIALDITIPPTPEVAQLDDEFRRMRLEEVTVELLTTLLRAPTLFIFEDTHWMDEASSDLLRRLSGEVHALPWLMIVTRRDVEEGFAAPAEPGVETLHPQPLDEAAAAALVEAATEESPLAPHEIAALAERSGGNPLFLRELLAAARDAGGIEGLPDTVEALITARIDRLPGRERTVLKRLSVLGPTFHGELARAVIPEEVAPADDSAWERLEEFIAPEGPDSFRFRHALIRDAAYEGLPFRLRRSLHALVGETIERALGEDAQESAEILSLHFYFAHRFDRAWRYSRLAGDRALTIYANIEAAEFYERAIDASRRLEDAVSRDVAHVYEALGDVRKRMGEFPPASQAYSSARKIVGVDPIATARLMLKQAGVRQASGRFAEAIRWIRKVDRALAGVEGADAASQRAQTAVAYASVRKDQGRQSEVIKWCLKAIPEAEAAGDRDALAHAYTLLESAFVNLGMWEKAVYSGQALSLYEDLGDLWGQGVVLNNLGARAYFEGRWNEAVELYDRGREAWEKIGDAVSAAFGTVNAGEILSDQGRLAEAESLFRKASRIWKAAGDRQGLAYAMSNLGRLAYRRGEFEEATQMLNEARAEFAAAGAEADVLEADARIGECLLLEGRFDEALKMAEELLDKTKAETGATGPLTPMLYRLKGSALVGLCDLPPAREALERSLTIARERSATFEVALALDALAGYADAAGEQPDRYRAERRGILENLGVVAATVDSAALAR